MMNKFLRGYAVAFPVVVFAFLLASASFPEATTLLPPTVEFRWGERLRQSLATIRWRMGDRVFGDALVGKDGWFFLVDEPSMRDYQRTVGIRTAVLYRMQRELDRLNTHLAARGATLVVIVPPDKSSIYPELMPEEIPVADRSSRMDEFAAFMRKEGATRIVDLRPALLAARAGHQLFYTTDSHWNDLGAYFAYVEILNSMASAFPALVPVPLSGYEMSTEAPENRDMARVIGLDWMLEAGPSLKPISDPRIKTMYFPMSAYQDMWLTTSSTGTVPRLLVFRDSFYFWLAKFIEPHFARSTVVHYNRLGEGATMDDWIHWTSPDVVIIETTERSLTEILPVLERRP